MSWIFDHIPWWVWFVIAGGGGGAILAFVPGALALVVGIWNAMPRPIKIALAAIGAALAAYLAGRNRGARDATEEQRQRDTQALQKRTEIDDNVTKLSTKGVDDRLNRWNRD